MNYSGEKLFWNEQLFLSVFFIVDRSGGSRT